MPTYSYPGVYIQETNTGNKPIEGVSTSIVGFLGIAERGPVTATFVTSYADFTRSFGSYYKDSKGNPAYLAYAVEGFFLNGGQQCWIARVASIDAATPAKAASVKSATFQISAAGPGAYGGQIGYQIQAASLADPTLFKLLVYYWPTAALAAAKLPGTATQAEVFDNLSTNSASSTYFVGTVNSGSNLVTVAQPAPGAVAPLAAIALLDGSGGGVAGADGAALVLADFQGSNTDPANPTGLAALAAQDDISILCCPDENSQPKGSIAGQLQSTCMNLMDRFAILQSGPTEGKPSGVVPTVNSSYTAYYYPWVNVVDPTTDVITLIPPGGHIAGIYARSDQNENVAKDPANEQIVGIDSIQLPIDNGTQGILNPIGVNCLRFFKGQGNLVWGGRTTSSDPDWIYISVRRLFIFIEKSIQQGTQWVVFEPNNAPTWARVIRSVSDFLTGLWMQDMLMGATKEEAFFVRCDLTTMTQTDIDSGRMIVVVGIAPVKPAEFVIFQIGQWTGGSSITEN
jgi:phage tail sheath protein FI